MRVLIFGDSITQGFFDSKGGWANRIIRDYNDEILKDLHGDWTEVFNLGISGEETSWLKNRISSEASARKYTPDQEFAFVIATGINDTVFRGSKFESSLEKYEEDLRGIIAEARKFTNRILFVGLTSVDDKKCNPWEYSTSGKCYTNDRIKEFNSKLRQLCNFEKVPFVDVFDKFQSEAKKRELFADGLHPNDAGHELIYNVVKPALNKLI